MNIANELHTHLQEAPIRMYGQGHTLLDESLFVKAYQSSKGNGYYDSFFFNT
jgi:hypothetical protein